MRWGLFIGWCVLLVRLAASDPDQCLLPATARRHVLMVNQRGQYLDPAQKWKLCHGSTATNSFTYEQNIAAIRAGIVEFSQNFKPTTQTKNPRVVLFVHGGLNSYSASQTRLKEFLNDEMIQKGFYPVLIVWNSGFISSYWEHLTSIRQGEVRPLLGPLTAPLIFPTDLAKGAVRLPLDLLGRWFNDLQTIDTPGFWDSRTLAWESLESQLQLWQHNQPRMDSNRPFLRIPKPEEATRTAGERFLRGTTYLITQPTKIASLPFADGLATEAWNNMIRRTKTLFQPPETYDFPRRYRRDLFKNGNKVNQQAAVDTWMARRPPTNNTTVRTISERKTQLTQPDGTMFQFAKELENWTTNRTFGPSLQWHFFGHSMGTMVLNELFRVAPDIRAHDVTYMAAACSIRSFQESMVPYLRRQHILHTNDVQFHNLCLHRIRERDNSMDQVDLIPRGTLLNYIDDLFVQPATVTDRTLGAWENLVRALPDLPVDLLPQIHHVCFDLEPHLWPFSHSQQPQDHSAFTASYPFWEDDFVSGPKTDDERALVAKKNPQPSVKSRPFPTQKSKPLLGPDSARTVRKLKE